MLQQAYTPSNTGLQSFVDASADYDLAPIGIGSMRDQVNRLAEFGRNGDIYVVHAAEGETVIPMEVLDSNPKVKEMLFAQMRDMGLDPNEFVVGNELNSINPVTGMPEFFLGGIFRAVKKVVKKVFKIVKKVAPIVIPLAAAYFGVPFLPQTFFGPGSFGASFIGGGIGSLLGPDPSLPKAFKAGLLAGGTAAVTGGIKGLTTGKGFGAGVSKAFVNPDAVSFQPLARSFSDIGEVFSSKPDSMTAGEFFGFSNPPDAGGIAADFDLTGGDFTGLDHSQILPAASTIGPAAGAPPLIGVSDGGAFPAGSASGIGWDPTGGAAPPVTVSNTGFLGADPEGFGAVANLPAPPSPVNAPVTSAPVIDVDATSIDRPIDWTSKGSSPGFQQTASNLQNNLTTRLGDTGSETLNRGINYLDPRAGSGNPANIAAKSDEIYKANLAKIARRLNETPENVPAKIRLDLSKAADIEARPLLGGWAPAVGAATVIGGAGLSALGAFEPPEVEKSDEEREAERQLRISRGPNVPFALDPGKYLIADLDPYRYQRGDSGPDERVDTRLSSVASRATQPVDFGRAPRYPDYMRNRFETPFQDNPPYAHYAADGGFIDGQPRYPRREMLVEGPGTERSDDIPAMLSDGEFVLNSRSVRGADPTGQGNRYRGAQNLYNMMRNFEMRG